MDVQLPTQRVAGGQQVGYGEAAREICTWHYHARSCRLNETMCIERRAAAAARQQNMDVARLRAKTLQQCLRDYVLGQPQPVAPSAASSVAQLGVNCAGQGATDEVWLAAIVRMQSRHLAYWVAWHLSIGVARLIIYDNHRLSEWEPREALRATLAPFGNLVTLVKWPGEQQQPMAYNHAMALAAAQNVSFVAALDVDELAVPYADGCLGPLLQPCLGSEHCGGISLNWRITRAAPGSDAAHPAATLLQAAGIDGPGSMGVLHPFVKTVARVSSHTRGSYNVHNNQPIAPYRLMGEDLRPIRTGSARMWTRTPPSGERAVVLHLHCTRLLDWVFKRSMRGDALMAGSSSCSTYDGAYYGAYCDLPWCYHNTCVLLW